MNEQKYDGKEQQQQFDKQPDRTNQETSDGPRLRGRGAECGEVVPFYRWLGRVVVFSVLER